jgi:FeS assembly SUF system regulator
MLKLSKMSDYATVIMTALAAEPGRLRSAQDLAERTHVSPPTVSKLLKVLTRGGLVESLRGAQGGYRLSRAPERISVADIIAALEGPIALTQCSVHQGCCSLEPHCGVRANWRLINNAIRRSLESVSLAQMAMPLHRHPGESRDPVPLIQMPAAKPLDSGLRRNDGA